MPSRTTRCTYAEGRRRCQRNGTGQPALCQAHRAVLEEVAQGMTSGSIGLAFQEFLRHGRVHIDTLQQAAHEVVDTLLASLGGFAGAGPARLPFPPPQHPRAQRMPPRPPPRPAIDQDELARMRARKVLGFGPKEKLTEDAIKARRRDLALRHHPDRGGNVQTMSAINASADVLLSALS